METGTKDAGTLQCDVTMVKRRISFLHLVVAVVWRCWSHEPMDVMTRLWTHSETESRHSETGRVRRPERSGSHGFSGDV